MAWRFLSGLLLALGLAAWSGTLHAQQGAGIRYLPLDAPAGMSQAVVVDSAPLVYTRQLLPLDRNGKLVGEGSAEKQSAQVLANLQAALGADFFDTTKFPKARFVTTAFHQAADGRVVADGVLTLRGISKPVTLGVVFVQHGATATLDVTAQLKRLDFGIGTGQWADEEQGSGDPDGAWAHAESSLTLLLTEGPRIP